MTFQEFDELSKGLDKTKTEFKHEAISGRKPSLTGEATPANNTIKQRGVLHLKPTIIHESKKFGGDQKPPSKDQATECDDSISSKQQTTNLTRNRYKAQTDDVSRGHFPNNAHQRSCLSPVKLESHTNFFERRSKTTGHYHPEFSRRKKETEVKVSRSMSTSGLVSKKTGEHSGRGYDDTLRDLITEWDNLDDRKVERALAKWNGDVTKLDPILKMW